MAVGTLQERFLGRLARLQKTWSARRTDRDSYREAHEYLTEDKRKWVPRNPDESTEHAAKKIVVATDLANHLLEQVASVYDSPPSRTVNNETSGMSSEAIAEADRWLTSHIWDGGKLTGGYTQDAVLQDVDPLSLYGGTVAIEPRFWWDSPGRDGIELIRHLRHRFEVLESKEDVRKAEAVIFTVKEGSSADLEGALKAGAPTALTESDTIRHYWDGEVFCRLRGWSLDTTQGEDSDDPRWQGGLFEHGLGWVPVLFRREGRVYESFYHKGNYTTLMPLCVAHAKSWTEFLYVLLRQHGYVYTDGELANATLAVDGVIQGEKGQKFEVNSPGANLDGMLDGIQRMLDNLAMTFKVPPGSIAMDPQAIKSGVSLMLEQQVLEEVRLRRAEPWSQDEEYLLRCQLAVYWAFAGGEGRMKMLAALGVPLTGGVPDWHWLRLTVGYRPPQTHVAGQQTRSELDFMREHGLITRAGMLRVLVPGLTESEIDARLKGVDGEVDLELEAPSPVIETTTDELNTEVEVVLGQQETAQGNPPLI